MPTSDAAFLAEVEQFLSSHALPRVPSLQALSDLSELDDGATTLVPQSAPHISPPHKPTRRRAQSEADLAARKELVRARDRRRRRASRERRLQELESLNRQIEHLSKQLQELQQREESSKMLALWRAVAQTQKQARSDSERQQRRLCARIQARSAVLRELWMLVDGASVEQNEATYSPFRAVDGIFCS